MPAGAYGGVASALPSGRSISTVSSQRPCLKPTDCSVPIRRKPTAACTAIDAAFAESPITAIIWRKPRASASPMRRVMSTVFVVSGGGRDFMRVFAEDAFGIYKENVIGTAAEYSFTDGKIVRAEHALGGLDVGKGKPEHIFAHTGRLPVFGGGNADVTSRC